jgi:hypothetical protein
MDDKIQGSDGTGAVKYDPVEFDLEEMVNADIQGLTVTAPHHDQLVGISPHASTSTH